MLDALNARRFAPDRGDDSVAACEVALARGGFYGPVERPQNTSEH